MVGIRDTTTVFFLLLILTSSIITKRPNYFILVIFGYSLGFLRRFLPSDSILASSGIDLDPLLLVIPLSYLICILISEVSEIKPKSFDLSMKMLVIISTIGIFNPRQGSLLVGMTGWIAYVVPILFLYLGSKMDTSEFVKILNLLKNLGLCVCIYGFFQVKFGYATWDQRWFNSVTRSGEYSVVAYGTNRPFGTFSSIGEYAQAIGIAAGIVSYQYIRSEIKLREHLTYTLIFLISASLTASRSALIITFMIALSPFLLRVGFEKTSKSILPVIIPTAMISIWVLPWIVSSIPPKFLGSASTLVARQAAGLSGNNSGVTSASVHLSQTRQAFVESFSSVFGYGTGAISGAQRLNGSTRMNFESDLGNASYAFGVMGFVCMLFIFYGLYSGISKMSHMYASLAVLILLPSINNWFNPGHYATVWVIWLLVGKLLGPKLKVCDGEA